jgi:hypothetical protein
MTHEYQLAQEFDLARVRATPNLHALQSLPQHISQEVNNGNSY